VITHNSADALQVLLEGNAIEGGSAQLDDWRSRRSESLYGVESVGSALDEVGRDNTLGNLRACLDSLSDDARALDVVGSRALTLGARSQLPDLLHDGRQ
jgi:hypothetical protein